MAMLRAGVDIALQYFNSDDQVTISALTQKAKQWADRYFKGYPYATKRSTALLTSFPNLFNLRIPGMLTVQILSLFAITNTICSPPSTGASTDAFSRTLSRARGRQSP